MPVDPTDVDVAVTPTKLTFTFPKGTVLEVGQTYTVTVAMKSRPNLTANTSVTNTTGISGERPWDECDGTLDGRECTNTSTVKMSSAGALRGFKAVRAIDTQLGVLDTRNTGCTADEDGFYVGGCVPVTKPGGDEVWRLTWVNTGNLPYDQLTALDQLPAVNDTTVIVDNKRGSQWRPIPKSVSLVGAERGSVSKVTVWTTTNADICPNDLNQGGSCPDVAWVLADEEVSPANGWSVGLPADTQALKFQFEFKDQLAPQGPSRWTSPPPPRPSPHRRRRHDRLEQHRPGGPRGRRR
ncbi:hypothetical protein G7085_16355 [Tessaracoccus sp. HDW20]|uniref:hypothetical protein n=1 Tax=Tessaracoccus coleopterorum TaxID=2714950 RepID=UPI0018D3F0CE|nr:hypothetical protein [Tessaracoccus coleopterorum]NHB85634.1 hypothetical protein [Tessaracoccus coleopterorum]